MTVVDVVVISGGNTIVVKLRHGKFLRLALVDGRSDVASRVASWQDA
jgi:hypothetical protein